MQYVNYENTQSTIDIVSLFSDNTIKTREFITNVINNVGFGPDIGIYSKKLPIPESLIFVRRPNVRK